MLPLNKVVAFFMPKKDFNEIPPPFKSLRTTSKMSPKIPEEELLEIPGDACGELPIPKPINLLPGRRGRKEGETIIYSPDETYNYLSVSERDNKSLDLLPAYTREEENRIVYSFCSHNSPSGFWEVVVNTGQVATFAEFDPGVLTILCPRPFQLSELTTLNTDSNVFQWSQISGSRTVFITPDNVADPVITIESSCFTGTCDANTQLPIRLRVETDNPLVFADLIILNRAVDNFDGLGYVSLPFTQVECRKITTIYLVPRFEQKAYVWLGTQLDITWLLPSCDTEFIYQYRIQQLTTAYADIETIPATAPRKFLSSANTQYRLLADFNIFGREETSVSEPLIYRYDATDPLKTIFADDSGFGLGYASISSITNTDVPGVQIRDVIEQIGVLGYISISSAYNTDVPGVQVRDVSESIGVLGYVNVRSEYVITDLGGIVIG